MWIILVKRNINIKCKAFATGKCSVVSEDILRSDSDTATKLPTLIRVAHADVKAVATTIHLLNFWHFKLSFVLLDSKTFPFTLLLYEHAMAYVLLAESRIK